MYIIFDSIKEPNVLHSLVSNKGGCMVQIEQMKLPAGKNCTMSPEQKGIHGDYEYSELVGRLSMNQIILGCVKGIQVFPSDDDI